MSLFRHKTQLGLPNLFKTLVQLRYFSFITVVCGQLYSSSALPCRLWSVHYM